MRVMWAIGWSNRGRKKSLPTTDNLSTARFTRLLTTSNPLDRTRIHPKMSDSNSYLTPLSTVLFIFSLCTAYMFLAMNGTDYTYVGDYKFILFKVMITISTVAIGFIITITSVAWYSIPRLSEYDISKNTVVCTFLMYLSSIWISLAVAMLPFGHTVYIAGTNNIDQERTAQLRAAQQAIYSGPYYILMIFMSVNLFVFALVIGARYFMSGQNGEKLSLKTAFGGSYADSWKKMMHHLRPTFGCYFTVGGIGQEGGRQWGQIAKGFQMNGLE